MGNNHVISLGEKTKMFFVILISAVSSFLDYAPMVTSAPFPHAYRPLVAVTETEISSTASFLPGM